jgi:hypothetical protein
MTGAGGDRLMHVKHVGVDINNTKSTVTNANCT